MSNFYINNDSNHYYHNNEVWGRERDWINEFNGRLLSFQQANQLNISQFISKNKNDEKPRLNHHYNYLTIPYELGEEMGNNQIPDMVICDLLNQHLKSKPTYLASSNPEECCVISFNCSLNDDLICIPYSSHINTPFLIFNENADIFALIDYDLPLQIIGYKPHLNIQIDDYDVIQNGFNDVFERYGSYTNMKNLFKTYYDFLLPEWFLENL